LTYGNKEGVWKQGEDKEESEKKGNVEKGEKKTVKTGDGNWGSARLNWLKRGVGGTEWGEGGRIEKGERKGEMPVFQQRCYKLGKIKEETGEKNGWGVVRRSGKGG